MTKSNKTSIFAVGAAWALVASGCGADDDSSPAAANDDMASVDEAETPTGQVAPEEGAGEEGSGDETPPAPEAEDPSTVAEVGTIVEVAQQAGTFNTLLAAAEAAGLVEALQGDGPLTVFAPSDEAFAAVPQETLDALLADPEELAAVLQYHVVAGDIGSSEISDGDEVDTLLGPWLTVEISGGAVSVGGANVSAVDVKASNGVIHVIDSVLLPPATIGSLAASTEDLSTLVAALTAADLVETLEGEGPFTVFAPTDAAFAALPEGTVEALLNDADALSDVLLYHVVEGRQRASAVVGANSLMTLNGSTAPIRLDGESVSIAGARIDTVDVPARNGVIHILDAVMLPPDLELVIPEAEPVVDPTLEPEVIEEEVTEAENDGTVEEPALPGTLIEVAASAGTFQTLLAAVEAADLVEALSGEGPLTVFAPTDEAFDALPDGALQALLDDPAELAAVLQYHVIAGAVAASSIEDGARVDTLLGPWLDLNVRDAEVSIGEARVIAADVAASNGVIHVIDSVLLPPPTIADLAASTPELSTLTTALEAAGLVEALDGAGQFTVFAPTNAAFEALPEGALSSLLDDTEALSNVLLFHVVDSRQPASSVIGASSLMTLSGNDAGIELAGTDVLVAGARVGTTDIIARNGVIHLMDAVMLP